MPSSRDPTTIPEPERLLVLMRSLALLDALIEPRWEFRYHSFDPAGRIGSMRNGEGDWFAAWLPSGEAGVIRGFDHESPMSPFRRANERPWPGVFEGLPDALGWARSCPGFVAEEITFCLWFEEGAWRRGPIAFPAGDDPDGSAHLLALLDDEAESYVAFARRYYERELAPEAVAAVYDASPLDHALLAALAPDISTREAAKAAREVGYPMAKTKQAPKKKASKKQAAAPSALARRRARVAAMKEAFGFGEASFEVELKKHTVRMVAGGETVAEVTVKEKDLYDEIFELVKRRIEQVEPHPARVRTRPATF